MFSIFANATKMNYNYFYTSIKFTCFYINSCNARKNETISKNRKSCEILKINAITITINEKKTRMFQLKNMHNERMSNLFIEQIKIRIFF